MPTTLALPVVERTVAKQRAFSRPGRMAGPRLQQSTVGWLSVIDKTCRSVPAFPKRDVYSFVSISASVVIVLFILLMKYELSVVFLSN
jgi:hypothetical protein